jgi:hypothetical protein
MKTTLDLPSGLVHELQLHAQSAGLEVDRDAAELLRLGLMLSPAPVTAAQRPRIGSHPVTGLPVVFCQRVLSPAEDASPDEIASLLNDQDAAWHHEAGRY